MNPWLRRVPAAACIVILGCAARDPGPMSSAPPHQPPETPGAGRALLHEAIGVLSTRPIGARGTDWPAVEAELSPAVPPQGPPESAHAAIREAVARLHDPHAAFLTPAEHRAWKEAQDRPADAAPASPPASDQAAPAPTGRVPNWPEVAVLSSGAIYIVVPGCATGDTATLQRYARYLRRLIVKSAERNPPGWVIDLRLNGGGNVWPMLLGLRPLLGDGIVATSLEPSGISRFGCDATTAWIDWPDGAHQVQLTIEPPEGDHTIAPAPIAVLIGGWTMSSGEVVAAALRSLPNARLFGEPTAGLTTVTNFFGLSDGSVLNLPVGAVGGRDGSPIFGPIRPDEALESGDWPGPDDEAASAAEAWIESGP